MPGAAPSPVPRAVAQAKGADFAATEIAAWAVYSEDAGSARRAARAAVVLPGGGESDGDDDVEGAVAPTALWAWDGHAWKSSQLPNSIAARAPVQPRRRRATV